MVRYSYKGKGFANRSQDLKKYSSDFLRSLFESMLRIRLVQLEIAKRYHLDEMKTPVHLMVGQEATAVGACMAMDKSDQVYSSHRTHGIYLAKGGNLNSMLCELYGKANGCVGSRGGSMHLLDKEAGFAGSSSIVAGIIPIAAGAALASKIKGEKKTTTVFFGEAANEEGVCSETINFATLKKLPLILFCENNFYSVCSPLHVRQPITEMYKRAAGFGIHAISVDGTNVLDVFEATQNAIQRANAGEGATYIEAPVYRLLAHSGASDDSHTGYRALEEHNHWENAADPIKNYKSYLISLGVLTEEDCRELEKKLLQEILASFDFAIHSPYPEEKDLYRNVYAMG